MNLRQLRRHWNRFGQTDPLWAILADPDKKGNRWQIDEFFRTGKEEVAAVMSYVRSLGIEPPKSRALDFGSGIGRLTQALAKHFEEAWGVDIAPSMIQLAEKYNRHPGLCKYYVNTQPHLRLFEDATFGLIYTSLTLQHMRPEYARAYLKEFLRLLVPRGILIFQMPSERVLHPKDPGESARGEAQQRSVLARIRQAVASVVPQTAHDLYLRLRYPEPFPRWEMYGIRKGELERFLEVNGAQILGVVQDQSAGPAWISYRYYVTRTQVARQGRSGIHDKVFAAGA